MVFRQGCKYVAFGIESDDGVELAVDVIYLDFSSGFPERYVVHQVKKPFDFRLKVLRAHVGHECQALDGVLPREVPGAVDGDQAQ